MRNVAAILGVLCLLTGMGCEKQEPQMPGSGAQSPPIRPMTKLDPDAHPKPLTPQRDARPAPGTTRIAKPTPLVLIKAPSPVEKPKASTSTLRTYTVQKKDTLWSIAKRHLGDGQRWRDILAVNPGLEPRKLMSGQIINLPEK